MYVNDLSFDPRDPLFPLPGDATIRWGIQIFTVENLYSLAPEHVTVTPDGEGLHLVCERLSWAGQQQRADGRVEVRVERHDGAWTWHVEARHDKPIKVVKLMLHGLPAAALDQGWWQATSPREAVSHPTPELPLRWRYPWPEWHTPWACAGSAEGGVCLSIRDPRVRAKRLYVYQPPYTGQQPIVELIWEEDAARWGTHVAAPPMRLRICEDAGAIDVDFAEHLAFLEQAYQLQAWEERSDVPAWMRDVKLVLNLHGQHWTGYVFNTFDRMADALRFVSQHIDGKQVLAYVPGWEGRYYYAYPFYRPGEDMGGDAGFRRLVQVARELGVHLMPMFGANGANAHLYPDWDRTVFRNRTNRYVKFVNYPDWDTDRSGEDDQVFLNPGVPIFREHLFNQVSAAASAYDLDGVFLDTSACWFNDPHANLYDGYRELLGALRQRHPDLLIAGEGWYDALLAVFPVNQSWMGVDRQYRYPQLLTRYGRALGHLAEGTPGYGSTGVHEGGFRPAPVQEPTPGHIPSLGIVEDTLEQHREEVASICRAAAERK